MASRVERNALCLWMEGLDVDLTHTSSGFMQNQVYHKCSGVEVEESVLHLHLSVISVHQNTSECIIPWPLTIQAKAVFELSVTA